MTNVTTNVKWHFVGATKRFIHAFSSDDLINGDLTQKADASWAGEIHYGCESVRHRQTNNTVETRIGNFAFGQINTDTHLPT